MIPHITGISERIRCACRRNNIKTVFKPGLNLHSMLTKVKYLMHGVDVQYGTKIPCSYGKVYSTSETKRRLKTRV